MGVAMNPILLTFATIWVVFFLEQKTTVIYTNLVFADESVCTESKLITLVIYNSEDTLKIFSNKCLDTIKTNKQLLGNYFVDIYVDLYISRKNQIAIDSSGELIIRKSFDQIQSDVIEEITITHTTNPTIEAKGNKLTFSVANNDALNNGSVLDAVLKLPGVISGIGNVITLNGKTTSIFIDGLPINFSGRDLADYLNSLSTENILKIEIINNPGAMYEGSSSSSIINIITYQRNKKGVGGIFKTDANFYLRQKYHSSIILNGMLNKLNWNFIANYSEQNYENSSQMRIDNQSNNQVLNNNLFNDGRNKPLLLDASLSYPIKGSTSISLRYLFAISKNNTTSNSDLVLSDFNNNVNLTGMGTQSLNSNKNDFVFKVNHRFGEKVSMTMTYNGFYFDKLLHTNVNNVVLGQSTNNFYINNFSLASNKIILDFEFLYPNLKLNFGGRGAIGNVSSRGQYFENWSNNRNIDFRYRENAKALYAEFHRELNKFSVNGGLRYELTNLRNKINEVDANNINLNLLLPSFQVNYDLSPMLGFNLSYSKKIIFPGYQELDPNNSGLINSFLVDQGNPFLSPSIYNNYEIRSSFLRAGYLSITYSNANLQNFAVATYSDGSYAQSIEPFYQYEDWGASCGMPFPLGIITKGFAYASTIKDLSKINYLYLFSGINFPNFERSELANKQRSGTYYMGANVNLMLPFATKLNFKYQHVYPGNYMVYSLDKSFYLIDVILSKSFIKENLRLSVALQDIFNTSSVLSGSLQRVNNLNLSLRSYNDTQRFRLSATFLFGNSKMSKPKVDLLNDGRDSKKGSLDFRP